eukprot:TRINITY_DN53231_c0_g1_i1.p1 TRINITY_DN53231_c0_g1~~TRINITY_DN53231_c0_g1_i1.p1  ORF type:complete len:542 (+),score=80.58 TRINITY_DN53231_c0_g1_i1:34-1626(+)
MVRYATGRAILSFVGDVTEAAQLLAESFTEAAEEENKGSEAEPNGAFSFLNSITTAPPQEKIKSVKEERRPSFNDSRLQEAFAHLADHLADSAEKACRKYDRRLQEQIFCAWKSQQQEIFARRVSAADLARSGAVFREALSMWCADGLALLKASICSWNEVVVSARLERLQRRSKCRAAFSPELPQRSPCLPHLSPAPMQKAVGAFLSVSDAVLAKGCFLVWQGEYKETKRKRAALHWLMERMALGQGRLMLQGVFRGWAHHTLSRQRCPSWANDLMKDVQTLKGRANFDISLERFDGGTEDEDRGLEIKRSRSEPLVGDQSDARARILSESFSSRRDIRSKGEDEVRGKSWSMWVMICTTSILVHLALLMGQNLWSSRNIEPRVTAPVLPNSGGWTDSDGDGVRDDLDRCPYTSAALKFQSSWRTDWDGDGCMDSVEDTDDDGDAVSNEVDKCPRTAPSETGVDRDGCSSSQRDTLQEKGSFAYFADKLPDIFLEICVGALVTAVISSNHWGRSLVERLWPSDTPSKID